MQKTHIKHDIHVRKVAVREREYKISRVSIIIELYTFHERK